MKNISFDENKITDIVTNHDIYDIIIKNIMKEDTHMSIQNDKWVVPEYSRKEIENAHKILLNENTSEKEYTQALTILNNWRAAHAYPLQVIASNLRRNNSNAIVVQRLKRLDSIINKLKRYETMNLWRMQDLGGCRVIVKSIDEVYRALTKFKTSKIRHELKREYDYIQSPKASGYRSYHAVYKFHSDTKDTYNKNMLIEIQFRTQLQHTWATAVEMMGIYTKCNLKANEGNDDILRFFTLVSSIFAKIEKTPICPNTSDNYDDLIKEIKYLNYKYNILTNLEAMNISVNHITKNKKYKYYILLLDYDISQLRVTPYTSTQINKANAAYEAIEKAIIENNDNKNIVLVSANNISALATAYPNYFVDISSFISAMDKILGLE